MTLRPDTKGLESSFAPEDEFLRWVHENYVHTDGSVSPGAFSNSSGTQRMSVNWSALSSVKDTLADRNNFGVVSITAQLCWDLSQEIEKTPTVSNPAHCDVVGDKPLSVKRKFANGSKWAYRP